MTFLLYNLRQNGIGNLSRSLNDFFAGVVGMYEERTGRFAFTFAPRLSGRL